MDTTTTVLVIICAVLILLFLAALLLVRVLRMSIFGIGLGIIRMIVDPKEEPTRLQPTAAPPPSSRDLRARKQELDADFDSAVARYSGQPVPPPPPSAQAATPPAPRRRAVPDPEDEQESPRRRRRRLEREDDEGALGGFLDEDNLF